MLRGILIFLIRVYRWVISPVKQSLFGPLGRCRFVPSCSAYAIDALQVHGLWRGSILALKRILRCHPWGGCGWDPVPPPDSVGGAYKSCCQQNESNMRGLDSHCASLEHHLPSQAARVIN
ncbi:MAG: membrane protein insertion efficiency factor YidD [Verrucomicrobiota bacterium]|nr:membrane protein insertion efficiency factor YidD [Verrucomicrobiota bacterium]